MIPELIGRLPVIASLNTLTEETLATILTKPRNALVKQYQKLLNMDDIELEFKGEGVDEKAYVLSCSDDNYQIEIGKEVLSVDPQYFRPTEVDLLIGDPTKAKEKLGWVPERNLSSLVKDMMKSDLELFSKK